ncbi:MAG: helix-hairpin-helix domain-containing protein [Bacteroidaceae bacterium]|nr:helix-hairpin-helix domain-containing protein [Bacteroidaceae bacterium]
MRRLPFLSRADRRALLLLEWLIVMALVAVTAYMWRKPAAAPHSGTPPADSTLYNTRAREKEKPSYIYGVPEEPVETFPFDPNTADSTVLLRLGLAPWQVRAIYRYRAKHGRYHTPEDFKRLPGMTGELWERLGPCVRIAERFRYIEPEDRPLPAPAKSTPSASAQDGPTPSVQESPSQPAAAASCDSVSVPPQAVSSASPMAPDSVQRVEKFPPGTTVDINIADTNMLKRIPGIASYRAKKIVEYRQQLGGFVSTEQAMEACEMPDEVLDWLTVGNPRPALLDVNHLSVRQLMRHPYLSFYQARDLVEYRQKHGSLSSLDELQLLPSFTPEVIGRLRPYVEFK